MKLDSSLPFFNVQDSPVDGSVQQRASHWDRNDDGVIQTIDGQMRAVPNSSVTAGADKQVVAMSEENKNALKSALTSIKGNIVTMFSSLTTSSSQAAQKADQFINSVLNRAHQSAEFELSLSSSASQFASSTLVDPSAGTEYLEKQAWTNIRGLNISVDNVSGEVSVDYSHVVVDISSSAAGSLDRTSRVEESLSVYQKTAEMPLDAATDTAGRQPSLASYQSLAGATDSSELRQSVSQKSSASSAMSGMNEASLRSLHAFMLTVTNVDGHEIGNAMDRAHEEGRLPDSTDRDTYISQWKALQKDPAFRHDITYDGRDELIKKNQDLLADYFSQNRSASTQVEVANTTWAERSSASEVTYDSPQAVRAQSVSLILDFLALHENTSINKLHFGREQTSFSLDLSFYLGEFTRSKNGRVGLALGDASVEEFAARAHSVDIKA